MLNNELSIQKMVEKIPQKHMTKKSKNLIEKNLKRHWNNNVCTKHFYQTTWIHWQHGDVAENMDVELNKAI